MVKADLLATVVEVGGAHLQAGTYVVSSTNQPETTGENTHNDATIIDDHQLRVDVGELRDIPTLDVKIRQYLSP